MNSLTRNQIESIMTDIGVCADNVWLADADYSLPGANWIEIKFATALWSLFQTIGATKWTLEQFDCDDFARTAAAYASILHHRSARSNNRDRTGLAFGEFWYPHRTIGLHAINVAIVFDGVCSRVLFFEPQNVLTGQNPLIQLNQEEKLKCKGYRF